MGSAGKESLGDAYTTGPSFLSKIPYFIPMFPFTKAYDCFAQWRADLDLPQPGTVENLQKCMRQIEELRFLMKFLQRL